MNINNTAHELWAMAQGPQSIEDSVAAIEEKLRSVSAETLPYPPQSIYPLKEEQMNNNWIKNTSGECPVEKGTLIDVKFRDGQIMLGIPALETIRHSSYEATYAYWELDNSIFDIIAWRHSVPQEQEAKPTYEGFCEWLAQLGYKHLVSLYEERLNMTNNNLQEAKKLLEGAGYVVKN